MPGDRTELAPTLILWGQLGCKGEELCLLGFRRNSTKGFPAPPRPLQVGVISWGVVDICKRQQQAPSYARDFHIILYKVLPWLKEKLKDEDLGFL